MFDEARSPLYRCTESVVTLVASLGAVPSRPNGHLESGPLAQIPRNTQNSFERVIVRIVRILRLGTRIFDQQLLVISDLL